MDFYDLLSFVPAAEEPKYSQKIYFAGDEETFKTHFEAIEKQIRHVTRRSKTTCTVWFRKHFGPLSEEENGLLLEFLSHTQMIIAPVTHSLLANTDGVLQNEIQFARRARKRILPIMLEPGLVELYSRPENFGDLQFLDPLDTDLTALPYEKKLENYLSGALINDATRVRIQEEYNAYIFLSYRKKDRAEARKLMQKIHQNDFCWDVAIWYDEYLIPGEDFNQTILEAMEKSHLFTLLVTPSVVEPDNYIVKHEYPMARELQQKKQLPILPVECVETDPERLQSLYKNIPPCAQAHTPELLANALRDSLKNVALTQRRDDPEHKFLIGLGYLGGVDVEMDFDRAISLITDGANAGLAEAKKKLIDIYQNGIGTPIQYKTALYWADQLIDHYKALFQQDSSWAEELVDACLTKLSLLTVMGEVLTSEQTILDAIKYAKHLSGAGSIKQQILLYMTLKTVKQKQKESEFPFEARLPNFETILLSGVPALMQAEALAMEHVSEPSLSPLICFLLVGIYALYFNIEDKENAAKYRQKVISFCEEYYPGGAADFAEYCRMDELKERIDWESLTGVEEYMELYLQVMKKQGTAQQSPEDMIPFVADFCDIISTLFREETADRLIAVCSKYIYRFLDLFGEIPLKEAGSNLLAMRVRLYSLAADFEERKENIAAAFEAENRCIYVAEEILRRNNTRDNRKLYFDLTHTAVKDALERKDLTAALRIAKAAYGKWQAVCQPQPEEDDLRAQVNLYTCFARIFRMQNKQDDAIAFYDAAAEAAVKLCNTCFTAQNIILVAKTHNDFAWYQYRNGSFESAVTLCEGCLNACGAFMEYQRAHQEALRMTEKEDQRFGREFRGCLTCLSWAYHATKQYDKEEPLLRSFLDTWEQDARQEWIEHHYYLGSCLLHQGKSLESVKYFEDYVALTGENVTEQNRRQYAMASYYASVLVPEKAEVYKPKAIEHLLVLFKEDPEDRQVVRVLAQLLELDLDRQEGEA